MQKLVSLGNNRILVILLYYIGNDIQNALFICYRIHYILTYDKFMDIILIRGYMFLEKSDALS